jgi:hypothetical protein
MVHIRIRWSHFLCLLALAVLPMAGAPPGVVPDMLRNLHANGLNRNPTINRGLGGLWINWRYGANPQQTNFKGSGETDGPADPLRHDVLTDFRYLHNLLLWKTLHPADHEFDDDIQRFRDIVRLEFADTRNERGWLYDELIDMYRLSKDEFYRQTARGLAEAYAASLAKPPAGFLYKTNSAHPHGYYRADLVLEAGCALIQAGREFQQPAWEAKGRAAVDFVYAHAWLPRYRTFLFIMDDLLLPDGRLNPDEKIYRDDSGRYRIDGGVVRMGSLGQMAVSLLHAYMASGDRVFLDRATDLLDSLTPKQNTLGLWDDKNLGYFNSAVFAGPGFREPGVPRVNRSKKESGRQAHMLEAFAVANALTGGRYREPEQVMTDVVTTKAYYPPGHGILYEQAPDWRLLPLKSGGSEDWVTSEAMGIALEALQQKDRDKPW